MTTTGPETGTTETAEMAETDNADAGVESTDWHSEAEKYRALMRKEESSRKATERELAKLRRDAMTDNERAVAEAVETAKAETVADVTARLGSRLVIAEIRGAVGGRLTSDAFDALTERLDLSTFLTPDGDVDGEAVRTFAGQIAPDVQPPQTFPDLGQGARPPAANNGANDPLLRDLKGKLGITT